MAHCYHPVISSSLMVVAEVSPRYFAPLSYCFEKEQISFGCALNRLSLETRETGWRFVTLLVEQAVYVAVALSCCFHCFERFATETIKFLRFGL